MHVVGIIDFWSGLVFACLGAAACVMALGFDSDSSTYPAALAAALMGLGLALVVKAVRRPAAAKAVDAEGSRIILWGPGLEVGVWCLWALTLWAGLGYIGPAFLAVLFLIMRHCADRRTRLHVAQAAGVAIGVFAIFYLIFQVPLPELEFIRDMLE
ncbi:tripartite tricarboxylate transporter TctB family protein [Oleispirillum naphthae]|uniref:tripartite tricarboxylate transporter TctB family protein n=1 Tax=Oleispirillum naphthae TaxID=2838853 RepID=UPI0030822387